MDEHANGRSGIGRCLNGQGTDSTTLILSQVQPSSPASPKGAGNSADGRVPAKVVGSAAPGISHGPSAHPRQRVSETTTQALRRIASRATLFKSPEGDSFAVVGGPDGSKPLLLRGQQSPFRQWLLDEYVQECGDVPGLSALASAMDLL